MKEIKFMLAKEEDIDKVFDVFKKATAEMNRNNIKQWDELYPMKEDIEDDINKKQLYMGIAEEKIVCVYVVNKECDDEYVNGDWTYRDSSFKVIHRLCVNPESQNKGIGTFTVNHIENELKKGGIETVRLDVFSLNPAALRMYEKLGYKKVGSANWRKGEFYLMEKAL